MKKSLALILPALCVFCIQDAIGAQVTSPRARPAEQQARPGVAASVPVAATPAVAEAAVTTSVVMAAPRSTMTDADIAAITATRDDLKREIAHIDSEMARCKKQKTGWVAGTVVGSVGVVATGVAAGVQAGQIKNKKSELEDLKNK